MIVIIVGVVVATIASFLLLGGVASLQTSRAVEGQSLSRAAANSCAELALAAIQANTSIITPSSGSSTLSSTTRQACTFIISGTTPNYTITAVGTMDVSGQNYTH